MVVKITEEKQTINKNNMDTKFLSDHNNIEKHFKILLDNYVQNHLQLPSYETIYVPSDGSCLYHAILQSFHSTYTDCTPP
jgi:hypothetical protein